MFYSCCFIIRAPLKKVRRSPPLRPPLAGADWGASFIYHPDKSVFPGKSFRKLQTPSLLISPPLHLGTGIHLPPPCIRQRGCRAVVLEVEIEVKKTKRIDRKRDSEIKEKEASPLHNNMGDLTLLHCSTSCYLQLWADERRDRSIHGMVITHWNDALRHMNESNRKIICTAYILCQVFVGKAFVDNQGFLAHRYNNMKKRQQSLNSSNNKGSQGETWGVWN